MKIAANSSGQERVSPEFSLVNRCVGRIAGTSQLDSEKRRDEPLTPRGQLVE